MSDLLSAAAAAIAGGRWAAAETALRQALAAEPGNLAALRQLAIVLARLGRSAEAIALAATVAERSPQSAAARYNLGKMLHDDGRLADAIVEYDAALVLRPDLGAALSNKGAALLGLHRAAEALDSVVRAVALDPNDALAHNNHGNALLALERADEALAAYERAIVLRPAYAEALNNAGNALKALNRRDEALRRHGEALALDPGNPRIQLNESLTRLAVGDYAEGWRRYECRWRDGRPAPHHDGAHPLWLGQFDLSGRTILLHAEQGFGDTLQFARYIPLVARHGATVVLEVPPALAALLGAMPDVAAIIETGTYLPAIDCHCPLASLPLAFGTTLSTIPSDVPYLTAPGPRLARWRERLASLAPPRIGLVWSGSAANLAGRNRSVPLAQLRSLLEIADASFVTLQKDVGDVDAAELGVHPRLTMLDRELADLADTAAVMTDLDLVITIDTATAHLAGALGRPVWVMLPFSPDWRWPLDRDTSRWYPTARLFRQPTAGAWPAVVETIAAALTAELRAAAAGTAPAGSRQSR